MEYTAQQISSSFVLLEKLEEELFEVQHLCPLNFNNLYVWDILKKKRMDSHSAKHKWKRDTFPEHFWTNPNIILNIDSAANTKAYCTNQKKYPSDSTMNRWGPIEADIYANHSSTTPNFIKNPP